MNFTDAFKYIIGEEGGLSLSKTDPGNWTGGAPGKGDLKGTKYGISAAQYPTLNISALTLAQAQAFAKRDYWDQFKGDSLPYAVALLVFDETYNAGLSEAVKCAQRALGLVVDGVLGGRTQSALAGLNTQTAPAFAVAFTTHRIHAYSLMAGWSIDGVGWTHRALTTLARALAA